jgi:uncharacterized membrane protein YfhO
MVYKYEVIKNKEMVLKRLNDPDFNYRETIILEEDLGIDTCRDASLCVSAPARIIENKINSLTIEAKTDIPGFLVLAENNYPSWKAIVDGKETKIYTADYIFRAIPLDKGVHKIKLVYDSKPYKIGKTSSLLTAIFYIFILGFFLTGKLKQN